MKAFWENYFCDLGDGSLKQDEMANMIGKEINLELSGIEQALKDYDTKLALELIRKTKEYF